VHSAAGLFPSPVEADKLGSDELATKRSMFKTLGMVVAKALMDSRIVDIPFSKMFMKIVLNQHIPLTIASVKVSNVWQTDPCG
jgi:E3 ubiquitin-protein ligase TRIP12